MKRILWLASWYPSKVDPYAGDFIERHARAAATGNHIQVLYVIKDNRQIFPGRKWEENRLYAHGGEATVIYFNTPAFKIGWVEKLYSNCIYLKIHTAHFKEYIRKNGKPDGIHVHVGMRAGMAALLAKWKFHIPYVVTEHWSGFCAGATPDFQEKPFIFRGLWKLVMKNASGYSAVSEYLAGAIQNRFSLKQPVQIIPNVVDTTVFYPSGAVNKNVQFIHISTLTYQKNVEQILEAAAILKKQLPDFALLIFGEPREDLVRLTHSLNIQDVIEFKGTCPQEQLCHFIQQSRALLLYSLFETFGCVIIEANACGKPVIVSDIPVLHENVSSGVTGVFVPLNNPGLLAESMFALATNPAVFDSDRIEKYARNNYSFELIERRFNDFYKQHFG